MPQPCECSSCASRARSPRRRHPSAHRPHVRGAAARSGGQPSARSHPQPPHGRPVSKTRARRGWRGWRGRDVARSEHGGILPSRWAAACCRSSPGSCHRDRRHAVDPSSQRAIRAPPPSYACEPAEECAMDACRGVTTTFVMSPGSGINLPRVASSYASSTGGKPQAANSSGSTNVVSSTTRPSAPSDMTVRQTEW
jgi:hypothetical protein